MPPCGLLEDPLRVGDGAGERAARVAEELRFEHALGERAAVDRHERARRAPAVRVDRARDELLAGAAVADDEHRRGGVGRVRNLLVDRQHAGRAADQAGRRDVEGGPRSAAGAATSDERALDGRLDFRDVERLADVVERAGAHRIDRRLQRPEPADQHDVALAGCACLNARSTSMPFCCASRLMSEISRSNGCARERQRLGHVLRRPDLAGPGARAAPP